MANDSRPENPYVGPRPFERADSRRFFGRDQEAADLVALVVVHRTGILYSPSGAGKTSLLNARVIPLLEQKGFETLPIARVQGPAFGGAAEDNPYIFNALMSIAGTDAEPADLAGKTIASFLASQPHFEDKYGLAAPRLLIVDQFEELFTTYPERWPQREAFFAQLEEALAADPLLRVILSLREDYVAQLDSYADYLPAGTTARYHLERMRPDAALEAVNRPLEGTGRTFAPEAAAQLVADLCAVRVEAPGGAVQSVAGEYVEPVQLQVVCSSLWRELPPSVETITSEHIATYGNVGEALAQFYRRALQQTVAETGLAERKIRRWFEEALITPAGTRGTVYRGQEETGGLANGAVDALEDEHVIRGEWRAGSRWYELTHDRLIEPIEVSNRAYDDARRELWLRRLAYGAGGLVTLLLLLLIGSYALREPEPALSATNEAVAQLEYALATTSARDATSAAIRATSDFQATGTAEARATVDAAATLQMQTRAAADQEATATAAAYAPTATAESRLAYVSADVAAALKAYNAVANDPQATAAARDEAQQRLYAAQTDLLTVRFEQAAGPGERSDALADLLAVDPQAGDPAEERAAALLFSLPPPARLSLLANFFSSTEGLRDPEDKTGWTLFFAMEQRQQEAFFGELEDPAGQSEELVAVVTALVPVFGQQEEGNVLAAMLGALETAAAAPPVQTFLRSWEAGRRAAAAGDYDGAIAHFSEAIRLEPDQPVPYLDRASARAAAGDNPAALLADLEAVAALIGATPGAITTLPLYLALDRLYDTGEMLIWMGDTYVCAHPDVQQALVRGRADFPTFGRMTIFEEFRFDAWPTEYPGRINQAYNVNAEYYGQFGLTGHEGVDIMAPQGSAIFAVAPGVVIRLRAAGEGHPYGNAIYLEHWACDGVYRTIYAQLSAIGVEVGQFVAGGEQIGLAGNTGQSFGAHLHLTLQKEGATARGETAQPSDIVDPGPFLTPWMEQAALAP